MTPTQDDRHDDEDVAVTTLLVLGATGDLAARLMLPGLAGVVAAGRAGDLSLVGSGTEGWDDATWRERVTSSFAAARDDADAAGRDRLDAVVTASRYRQADVTDPGALHDLLADCGGPVAVYFALPPAVTMAACRALSDTGVPPDTRLVLEKPFGTDAGTAAQLNDVVARLVPEDQVHRVDHFLGKSTVLNLLGLRFANRILEPLWNAEHVERVDVVFDETLGLEGRARYYDSAGALRDMVQSHLLQVLAVLAMEPPSTLGAVDLRDGKAGVLRATRLAAEPGQASRRARYTAGRVGDRDLPAYAESDGVDPARGTETLADVVLSVDTWRWAGVPFRLRSGKAVGTTRKQALVTFKQVPHLPTGLRGTSEPARLRIGFGPDRLDLELDVNGPGDPFELQRVSLGTAMCGGDLTAYGEVLAGVLEGDPTLSVRGDTAVEGWRILEPILGAWSAGDVPLETYPAGSDGPEPTAAFPALG